MVNMRSSWSLSLDRLSLAARRARGAAAGAKSHKTQITRGWQLRLEKLRYRYRCTLHTHTTSEESLATNTQDTQELTTAKQTPGTTEQVLEKETHEPRFGNGLVGRDGAGIRTRDERRDV